jgi:hypothetical protein
MGRYKQNPNGKGSLKLIHTLINDYPHVLNSKLPMVGDNENPWVSPLREDEFAEYRDQHFIKRIKMEDQLSIKLEEFWPKYGPQWDALGKTVNNEVLLVEAKANLSELQSSASAASNEDSIKLIHQSLEKTKAYIGADPNADWADIYYQYSNRMAHLFYLRVLNHIPAYLIFVYFIGDASVNGPTTKGQWETAIQKAHNKLGIPEQHPLKEFILDLFIDIKEIS